MLKGRLAQEDIALIQAQRSLALNIGNLNDVDVNYLLTYFFSFGVSFRKDKWKKHFEPGPGSYDIPSTIAGIPNYLLNSMQYLKSSENSKYESNYIQEINENSQRNEEEEN